MLKRYVFGLICSLIFISGCKTPSNNNQTTTTTSTTSTTTTSIPAYPFENKNMLFGISQVSPAQHQVAMDLGVSWVTLQPSVFWFNIEAHIEASPGTYDWTALDNDVKRLQLLGLEALREDIDTRQSLLSIQYID